MGELIQDRASVIYYINKAKWMEYGGDAQNYFTIFNIEILPKKCY